MPILEQAQIVDFPQTHIEWVGKTLFDCTMAHANDYMKQSNLSLSFGACHAAVAIQPNAAYRDGGTSKQLDPASGATEETAVFSIVYGNSRLYRGLDMDFNNLTGVYVDACAPYASSPRGEHAEQTAIRVAQHTGQTLYTHMHRGLIAAHVYVDIPPCPDCRLWLQNSTTNWIVHFFQDSDSTEEGDKRAIERVEAHRRQYARSIAAVLNNS